ncbi:MAG: hypothetical protein COV31_00550 [Candidatus Yanofskybacteria bacterium CG10_big_fil_rev_8_21_14_0_10_46_23]|uniref:Uncharacterized protein n=1 Tax=Candidatus Yanofskybacteria bacterium CG10_big_fil_rev_8_21_14_0_10_46_23 TaxID=1975098 RepID=A0A2H0R6Y0_9BACT|nr:MAG: hypothetical protein COV31_00550 [Candidatus Yanofskybacteria bacterium CG10_big_fil_rev_8_21_14_0_10_46_23]
MQEKTGRSSRGVKSWADLAEMSVSIRLPFEALMILGLSLRTGRYWDQLVNELDKNIPYRARDRKEVIRKREKILREFLEGDLED